MAILTIVLNLRSAGEPIAKGDDGLPGPSQVPTVHVAVDGTRYQAIGVVSRKVDVCDGSAVTL
jgi:hypothetical protein